jgi:WD40 repeat protein
MAIKKIIVVAFFALLGIQTIIGQNKAIFTFADTKGIVFDFCFSADGKEIFVAAGNIINVYDYKTQQLQYSLTEGHENTILKLAISPDNSHLVSGGRDSSIVLWDLSNRTIIKKLKPHSGIITALEFSPDNLHFASGASDGLVLLHKLITDTVDFRFSIHRKDVSSLDFNNDGSILLSASEDGSIVFSNTITGEIDNVLNKHKAFVRAAQFNNSCSRMISVDDKSNIFIWNTENISVSYVIAQNKLFPTWATSADFYSDNESYAAANAGGKVSLVTNFSKNTYRLGKPIHRIRFIPGAGVVLKMAVATHGKGIQIIDTSK